MHADHWQGNKRYPFAQGIYPANTQTLGDGILHQFSESTHYWWCWVAVGVLIGYILLLNVLIAVLLTVLPRKSLLHCCVKRLLLAQPVALVHCYLRIPPWHSVLVCTAAYTLYFAAFPDDE